ncbi:MAG: leucine-rich repeat domain-containing protein [Aristaeellaceae bacterium]
MKTCLGCGYAYRDEMTQCPLCGQKDQSSDMVAVPFYSGFSGKSEPAHQPEQPVQTMPPSSAAAPQAGIALQQLSGGHAGAVSLQALVEQGGTVRSASIQDLVARMRGREQGLPLMSEQEQRLSRLLHFEEVQFPNRGMRILFSADELPPELVLPAMYRGQPVIEIAPSAFANARMISVCIPETVTRIGDHAFENCRALTSVKGCAGLTVIGHRAFAGCCHLTDFELPEQTVCAQYDSFAGCFDGGMEIEARVCMQADEDEAEEWGL